MTCSNENHFSVSKSRIIGDRVENFNEIFQSFRKHIHTQGLRVNRTIWKPIPKNSHKIYPKKEIVEDSEKRVKRVCTTLIKMHGKLH